MNHNNPQIENAEDAIELSAQDLEFVKQLVEDLAEVWVERSDHTWQIGKATALSLEKKVVRLDFVDKKSGKNMHKSVPLDKFLKDQRSAHVSE